MDKLFLQIINMSITSSYVILFIIIARLFLKRLPKIFSYGLWGVAFLRLIFPFSLESIYSLISINTKTIPEDIIYAKTPEIQSGIKIVDRAVNRVLPGPVTQAASINPIQVWIGIGSTIWIIGLSILLIYALASTLKLSKNLRTANLLYDNVYQIDNIKTPFVFGILSPKIYLPDNLSQTERAYIIRHEETHIKRKDHIIKFGAFLITSIHWFNPLVWIGFYLMGEDMELSCDETVIREMGYEIKKDYSNSLLALSVGKRIIGGSPIAFGESNTKTRIKNILSYKRPKFWVLVATLVVIVALTIGLLINPSEKNQYKIDTAKIVRITTQIYPDGSIEKLDKSVWSSLINKINRAKWSELPEEDWPKEEDLVSNITVTLERDESVENKEYVLFVYDKGQGYSLALVYIDLTDDVKIWSLPSKLYYKIADTINLPNGGMTVEDYAWQYIDNEIHMYENSEWSGIKVIDKKITKLEKLSTFNNILASPVELWTLEYRLKPENFDEVILAGGMQAIDGWITEDSSMGKPNLVFTYENNNLIYLGNAVALEYAEETLASQEIAVRVMLENQGTLPKETYEGNHVVIKFPLSTGEGAKLLLSQPIIQGDRGIWAVERWIDGNGITYHDIPTTGPDGDIKIGDYYKALQDESFSKGSTLLLDPIEVGYGYIINTLGQILVTKDDLEIINPATIDDFY